MTLPLRVAALLPFMLASLMFSPPARADGIDLGAYKGKVVYLDF